MASHGNSQSPAAKLGPIYRAIWESDNRVEGFRPAALSPETTGDPRWQGMLETVRSHRRDKTLRDANGKLSQAVLDELAWAGYFGQAIPTEYGGAGLKFVEFIARLRQMAALDPTTAGVLGIHSCIGAAGQLVNFGSAEQKARWLPELASGKRIGCFAITEPAAGSDLTALRTKFERRDGRWLVSGEKVFITNAEHSRLCALVGLRDEKPVMAIVELPASDTAEFLVVRYGLHALRHTWNNGLRFQNYSLTDDAFLSGDARDGVAMAYHGLNRGRTALCANAGGSLRIVLAATIPWVLKRKTYGKSLAERELVRKRLARLAALIVGCDAVSHWSASCITAGIAGELEGVVAKSFGADALAEGAIDIGLRTHGGRSFLHGHWIGDHLPDYFAPSIYEGERDILALAFFRTLAKDHARQFFEPITRRVSESKEKNFAWTNPVALWSLRDVLLPYGKWLAQRSWEWLIPKATGVRQEPWTTLVVQSLQGLHGEGLKLSRLVRKHGARLAERQCSLVDWSIRIQRYTTAVVAALHGQASQSEIVRKAAEVLAWDALREASGKRASDSDFRRYNQLGEKLCDGGWQELAEPFDAEILFPYDQT